MIAHYFIDRPIFAAVLSILLVLGGGLAMFALPVAQYPPITPPTVQVACVYPGASARVVADTVAAPIEQQVNGVEGMLYMMSQSNNDGSYNLTITFDLGTNLNNALVLVQNRVSLANPQLPDPVQKQGVTVKKKSPDILLVVNLLSTDGNHDDLYLSNYATLHLKDELARLPGVGDIVYLGQRDYSIRTWLDPDRMAARSMTASEIVKAIQNQNQPLTPGQIGQPPVPAGQAEQLPLDGLGQLRTPPEFGDIIVKHQGPTREHPSSALVRLKDVASVELGSQQYDQVCTLNGRPSVALAIYQLPDANALNTAAGIRRKMEELKTRFPEGIGYQIAYDTTPFIEESVWDVVVTLRDAVILVALVVLVFLQNWRATLIPLVAVPVAIVGTFSFMLLLGFSFNTISLFGLVLAIGIVVDDAIVVVENVERWLHEGYSPRDAARKAMDEVTGPIVAIALVLCAVFVPCAFITGITGQFFRQFAITIAVSTVLSAFNSLTLSPALAALLLRPRQAKPDGFQWLLNLLLGWFFALFNGFFAVSTGLYGRIVGGLVRVSLLVLVIYGGLLFLTGYTFSIAPTGYIPLQDKGWLLVDVRLPDSASVQRTAAVMRKVSDIARNTEGIADTITVAGQSFLMGVKGSNYGSMFVVLKPFKERRKPELNGFALFFHLREVYAEQIHEGIASVFPAPPVNGLGIAGGFKLMIEDRAGIGPTRLAEQTNRLVAKASELPAVVGVQSLFQAGVPQLYADIDRVKARALGVAIDDVAQALQIYLGSVYVNNFTAFGRTWEVQVQAQPAARNTVNDIGRLQVRGKSGKMVPLATLLDVRPSNGPAMITRYNMYAAAPITGSAAPGYSTGAVIDSLDDLASATLPRTMSTEWTELTFMQIRAGNTALIVFALAVVCVFLVLAALYESWGLPLAVILVVPLCLLCSVSVILAIPILDVNILTQIGFVVLVGLASKNAILIVEFAKQLREEGKPLRTAVTEAARLRLRPILMTSFAFLFGVWPLVMAVGAGAEMRKTLGIAVFSGMLGVTIFGLFLTPVFFHVFQRLREGLGPVPRSSIRRLGHGILLGLTLGLPLLFRALFPHRVPEPGTETPPEEKSP